MILRLHGLTLPHDADVGKGIARLLEERLGADHRRLRSHRIVRRSIDARKGSVRLVHSVDIDLDGDASDVVGAIVPPKRLPLSVEPGAVEISRPPIIVGAGPAGLFAAYLLAIHGYRPIVVERGGAVEQRVEALRSFGESRVPDPECNALFGLGGAGTFSDGKLTTTLKHPWLEAVLDLLVEHGAPPRIAVDAKPHIGTDLLGPLVTSLAAGIERAGGRILTGTRMEDVTISEGRVSGARFGGEVHPTGHLVVAVGHSARDTWEMLASRGVVFEPKPFQMGIRVEHPQGWIDRRQYGPAAGHLALGAADYKLTAREGSVPVFSFCMCPGGETMPTVNEPGRLCLNGMSGSRRDAAFASSGIVATVDPVAHGGTDRRTCVELVRAVEEACFAAGKADYRAPAQRLVDFAKGKPFDRPLPASSYRFGLEPFRLDLLLPSFVAGPIRAALDKFNRDIPGFLHPDALALAPESRASSPLRMVRDPHTFESIGIGGLFPAGEGAGYAGGIMSSALDGLNIAKRIIESGAPSRVS